MRMHALAIWAIVFLIAGVGLLAAADDAKDDAIKKELQALKGAWKAISREVDGKKTSAEELKDTSLTWDEAGKSSVQRGDQVLHAGMNKIDPTKKPKTLDTTFSEGPYKGKTSLAIYELEGDTYRICRAASPGGERPTEFSSKAGSGHVFIVYKREKK